MNMQDLIDQDPKFWLNIFRLMDSAIIAGIYNAEDFGWAHREYLFSYISQKNNCDFCYQCHLEAAEALGFKTINPQYIELIDRLFAGEKIDDSLICQQLLQIISLAGLINTLVIANGIKFDQCNMLTTSRFHRRGYQQYASTRIKGRTPNRLDVLHPECNN